MSYTSCLVHSEPLTYLHENALQVPFTFEESYWTLASVICIIVFEILTVMTWFNLTLKTSHHLSCLSVFRHGLLAWSLALFGSHFAFLANSGFVTKSSLFLLFHPEPECFLVLLLLIGVSHPDFGIESASQLWSLAEVSVGLNYPGFVFFDLLVPFGACILFMARLALLALSDLQWSFRFMFFEVFSTFLVMLCSAFYCIKRRKSLSKVHMVMLLTAALCFMEALTLNFLYCLNPGEALFFHKFQIIQITLIHLCLFVTLLLTHQRFLRE